MQQVCTQKAYDLSTWVQDNTPASQVPNGVVMGSKSLKVTGQHRLYLLNQSTKKYEILNVLGKTIAFEVDLSSVPCGWNWAIYLTQMKSTDDASTGKGYCDGNCVGGSCCPEFDLLEANVGALQCASHSCQGNNCDHNGAYYKNKYSAFSGLDSSKPFTVKTSFVGSKIVQTYIQNGKSYAGKELTGGDNGGVSAMLESLKNGMVLVASLWTGGMEWLDGGCSLLSEKKNDQSKVWGSISNVRVYS